MSVTTDQGMLRPFSGWVALVAGVATLWVAQPDAFAKGTPLPERAYGHGAFIDELSRGEVLHPPFELQAATKAPADGPIVNREVMGYLPYWIINGGYTIQRWDLLTILAWFGAEMDSTGSITALHGWGGAATAALVQEAHAHGVKVIVTITNFNDEGIGTLLKNSTYRANAIQSCLDLMATHGADGINIDFEFVPVSAKQEFVSFMTELKAAVALAQPNGWEGHVSLAGPSVDWSGAYDYDQLLINTDGIMVMAYGYHYSGSSVPGPTSPLVGGGGFSGKSITTTVDEYMQFGGVENRHKVMIGLPWYGRDWKVANTSVPGSSLGSSHAVFYDKAENESAGIKQWHDLSQTAYYHIDRSDGLYQVWYDDAAAFEAKVAFVDEMDLGGIGIWALGYDATDPALWDSIEAVLTEPLVVDPGPEPTPEAGPEVAAELAPEVMPEVAPEVGPEPMPELNPETVGEPTAEIVAEVGPEPSVEPAPETLGPDVAAEAVPDAAGDATKWIEEPWHHAGANSLVETPSEGCNGGGAPTPWALVLSLLMLGLAARRRRRAQSATLGDAV